MGLPGTKVKLGNGQLGRISPSEDGTSILVVSGVAVAGKFALGDVLGPFVQPEDAVALGIDTTYDTTNLTKAYLHISDFYKEAPLGTKLYVMVVGMTQTLTSTALNTNTTTGLKKGLVTGAGDIKLVGLTFTPSGGYTPTFASQFEADLTTAIANLKTLWAEEFGLKRPFRAIVEGRNWQGTVAGTLNARSGTGPQANMVMIVMGNDNTVGGNYASVGLALGRAAASKVNRNIGRVKSGPVLSVTKAGFSNGAVLTSLTDAQQDALNDNGLVFFRTHVGKSGYYFNDDHMACPLTDDYAQLTLGRTIDKAVRITHRVNTDEILDEMEVDPDTGKLNIATVKNYEAIIENAINAEMTNSVNGKEIISVDCFVDPNQNVIATSKLSEVIKIVPTANAREIETTVEYQNPLT